MSVPSRTSSGCTPPLRVGFTLLELMMVGVVLGILVAVFFPQYTKTMERAQVRQAEDTLQAIRFAELVYFAKVNLYTIDFQKLQMDDPSSSAVAFSIQLPGANQFTATATRQGGGTFNGKTKTITQASPVLGGNWDV